MSLLLINALNFFSDNGYPNLKTTTFSSIIRSWFSIVNVKNPEQGKHKRDHKRDPISMENKDEPINLRGIYE